MINNGNNDNIYWVLTLCLAPKKSFNGISSFSCMKMLVTELCLTPLTTPCDYNPPGSSVCGIFQARILEWVAISYSRASSWPKDWTQISCIADRFYIAELSEKPVVIVLSIKSPEFITGSLFPLINTSPFPLLPSLWQLPIYSVSVIPAFSDSTYKSDHCCVLIHLA